MAMFSDVELAMIAIALDDEVEEQRNNVERRKWVHNALALALEDEVEEQRNNVERRKWVHNALPSALEDEVEQQRNNVERRKSVHNALDDEVEEPKQRNNVKRRKWVDNAWKKRDSETLFKELSDDEWKFFKYFRMSQNSFNILLNKLETHLQKKDTMFRKCISPRERLAVCLRYLVTGDSLQTISSSYCLGLSTVHSIVMETCKVISKTLLHEMMPNPTEEMWKNIAEDFNNMWNFPNCMGALDGKHIMIQAPPNIGLSFVDNKKTYYVVLLALVDAHYNFIAVDVGAYSKNSDGGIFANSNLSKAIEQGTLCIPGNKVLPQTSIEAPHVIVANESFPLKTYLMRPYPKQDLDRAKKIYNYRLCHARRVVENTFGILSQNFRIHFRRIQVAPHYVDNVILATCVLHNFIKKYDQDTYTKNQNLDAEVDGKLQFLDLPSQGGNATRDAFGVREKLKDYFNSASGSVPWQENKIDE